MASISQVTSILPVVRPFLSVSQLGAMASACRGEERAELGYISISELVQCGAELDLHFEPATLGEIKAARAKAADEAMLDNFNWVGSRHHY
jgi:hypothetical protein